MGALKRSYLSREEENFYMVAKSFLGMMEGSRSLENKITDEIWIEWKKRGMLTPSMQKELKLSYTYLRKFCYEVEENLDEKAKLKLRKRLDAFDFRIMDKYTLNKFQRDLKDKINYISLKREYFLELLEDVAAVRCVSCKENFNTCPLYTAYEDIMMPTVDEEENCPYACDLSLLTDEGQKNVKNIKNKVKKKNKFIKK